MDTGHSLCNKILILIVQTDYSIVHKHVQRVLYLVRSVSDRAK